MLVATPEQCCRSGSGIIVPDPDPDPVPDITFYPQNLFNFPENVSSERKMVQIVFDYVHISLENLSKA
jgi:hypothetical protein